MNSITLRKLINSNQPINYSKEFFAGLTVAMTMIPESLSFAILAGLSPLTGLYAAFLMGLVTSILGGRPGMVSGGAGATVIVLMALAASHGVEYLFGAVVLAGLIQFLVGLFKWGKFVQLIPQSVMYGFLNGLAIIIFMAQVVQFKDNGDWMQGTALYLMLGLTLLAVFIVVFLPKITKKIPSSLAAILVVFLVVQILGLGTKEVGDIASVSGALPSFSIPDIPFNLEALKIILPYAVIMASVGLVETLLTLNMVDEITQTKGKPNREAMAQGVANCVNGFFGGMGGCAMIAQTIVNLEAGSRTRLSAFIGSIIILLVILIGAPFIEKIPMAALVGVMMMAAISTFQWPYLRSLRRMPRADVFVSILVAVITLVSNNLALAVFVGVVLSALLFAWQSVHYTQFSTSQESKEQKHYYLKGVLFFGSIMRFNEVFDVENDPITVYVDFKESKIADMSAIEALNKITQRYAEKGKILKIVNIDKESLELLENAKDIVELYIE